MARASYWELHWERPAAVVEAASVIGGGLEEDKVVEGLRVIAERGDGWARLQAMRLLADRRRLWELMDDLRMGLRPPREYVREVLESVGRLPPE